MNVIPNNLNLTRGILVPLILLLVFLLIPAVIVALLPKIFRRMRRTIYGILALASLFVWVRLIFYTHLFFS